jgi:hypothetical protein
MMPPELHWLAGIIEGEGTFMRHTINGKWLQLVVRVKMTDEDVIHRCHEVAGVGNVGGPYTKVGRKPIWAWYITKGDDAADFMRTIRPLMGARRRRQIDACLESYATYLNRNSNTPRARA